MKKGLIYLKNRMSKHINKILLLALVVFLLIGTVFTFRTMWSFSYKNRGNIMSYITFLLSVKDHNFKMLTILVGSIALYTLPLTFPVNTLYWIMLKTEKNPSVERKLGIWCLCMISTLIFAVVILINEIIYCLQTGSNISLLIAYIAVLLKSIKEIHVKKVSEIKKQSPN